MTKPKSAPTSSPTPDTPKTFSFPAAMQLIIQGKEMTKESWKNPAIKVALVHGRLRIYADDKIWHDWIVSDGDMMGLDWMEVKNG